MAACANMQAFRDRERGRQTTNRAHDLHLYNQMLVLDLWHPTKWKISNTCFRWFDHEQSKSTHELVVKSSGQTSNNKKDKAVVSTAFAKHSIADCNCHQATEELYWQIYKRFVPAIKQLLISKACVRQVTLFSDCFNAVPKLEYMFFLIYNTNNQCWCAPDSFGSLLIFGSVQT